MATPGGVGAHQGAMAPPQQLEMAPCAAATAPARARSAAKMLPRFDPGVMETYLDDMREMKARVHELFRQNPDLLPNVEEGLSKGASRRVAGSRGRGRVRVHAFVVPLRDEGGNTLPGVEIRDCGYKVGLNGIDNGAIRFTHVRVPRANLLDRFASVDKSGRYSSPLSSQARRTARMLFTLSLRLRKHGPRLGAFHAWNRCLSHVLDLANAYVESVIYKTFLRAVAGCVDPDCRRALRAMADLFALRLIEGDMMFRNDEYIAPSKAKAISRLVMQLCGELRGVALQLVDAFAIPDAILRAPIGLGGGGSGAAGPAPDIYREYLAAAGFEV
ncbi:hypothetical protein GPECTOR_45g183 [Gonium pectorale]|uniref:acyl-CoA oxidase n=1 Tax=Gonium pectorale TaxID=33097 RepID=A0A150G971_GONPE|nr:hypothetical protein GPECTOR_45g183 [Gonium pectorale]|eukprot:KXZ46313.1 hypothetical protein GPECTOR_45g183 [Gonium pectorale]